jgi:hypothetical protein
MMKKFELFSKEEADRKVEVLVTDLFKRLGGNRTHDGRVVRGLLNDWKKARTVDAGRVREHLLSMNSDYERHDFLTSLGVCLQCGSTDKPCYCSPAFDI